ncbi:MAG: hypothetical protein AABM66_14570 [Actinomycetota bacterium]
MSDENVEIVKAVHPPSGTDLTRLFADDSDAPARLDAAAPLYHPEFEFSMGTLGEFRLSGKGLLESWSRCGASGWSLGTSIGPRSKTSSTRAMAESSCCFETTVASRAAMRTWP